MKTYTFKNKNRISTRLKYTFNKSNPGSTLLRITIYSALVILLCTVSLPNLIAEEDVEIEIYDENENKGTDDEIIIFDESEDTDEIPDADIDENEKSLQNIIDRFIHNSKGKTETKYSWFFTDLDAAAGADPEPDSQSHFFDQYITYSSFFQQGFFRFDLSTYVNIGNPKYTYASRFGDMDEWEPEDWFRDSNNRRNYFNSKECYVSLFFPVCDIMLGKKIFNNTLSSIYSPTDIYKAIDTHDPFDPRELGRTQAQVNFFISNVTFTFLIWPYYQGGKEFSPLSRWGYYKALEEIEQGNIISDMLTIDEKIYPPITLENISYLGKAKGTVQGWDFFVSAFHGLAGNTVSRITGTIPIIIREPEVVPVFQATAGFSTTIGRFELHAETLFNYTYELRDDHYLRSVGGLRYTFDELGSVMDKIEVTCEYAREDIFEKQDNPDYVDSTEEKRFYKNDLLALIRFQFTTKLKLNIYGQYALLDTAFLISPGIDYQVVDNLGIMLGTQFFIAPEGSDFYWWRDNNRLVAQVTYDY